MERLSDNNIPEKKKLNTYIYRDNSSGGRVVFECTATDILAADAQYHEATGQRPEKQNHIGCSVEDVTEK